MAWVMVGAVTFGPSLSLDETDPWSYSLYICQGAHWPTAATGAARACPALPPTPSKHSVLVILNDLFSIGWHFTLISTPWKNLAISEDLCLSHLGCGYWYQVDRGKGYFETP